MIIFPAVDIKDGVCVRLVQGRKDDQKVYGQDPVEMAVMWEKQGARWLHVVDLDGAFSGVPRNQDLIRRIASRLSVPVQLGGGIRDIETARGYLNAGVARVIIGTRAQADEGFVAQLLDTFGPDRIVIGIDARGGMVTVKGWEADTDTRAVDMGRRMKEMGVAHTVYTDVSKDGLLGGPNLEAIQEMAGQSGLAVIASGGVTSVNDLKNLKKIAGVEGAIIGKALYENAITLEEAIRCADMAD